MTINFSITLHQADAIIIGALTEARKRNVQPLAIMVLDSGGQPVAFRREDGASLFRHDIAKAKALGALGMGINTRTLADRAQNNPLFFNSLSAVTKGNVVFAPGGNLIKDTEGIIIGSVGISGDTGDIDEICAQAGITTAGLNSGEFA